MVTDSVHPYHAGGKEIRTKEVAERLQERFDVHVYTMKWWDGPSEREHNGVHYHAVCPFFPLYRGHRRSIRQALVFAVGCVRLLGRRFDLLEVDHMPYFPLFVLKAVAVMRRRRLVATWHEVWGDDYWRAYLGPMGRLAALIERAAMRLPDRIIAASSETADRLRDAIGDSAWIDVAPNGVDLDGAAAAPTAATGTDLVTVGRLLSHKRMDLLVDVVARLRSAGRPVTCRIIGSGPERAGLLTRIGSQGLGDSVEVLSDVADHHTLFSMIKASRVFVHLSEREGFGIVALEALACSTRVITTSAPDNLAQHLVRGAPLGTVCEPRIEEIMAAVVDAIDSEGVGDDELRALGCWLEGHSWSRVAEQVGSTLTANEARDRVSSSNVDWRGMA